MALDDNRLYMYTVPAGFKEDQVSKSTFKKPDMVLVVNDRFQARELPRVEAAALDKNFIIELEAESASAMAAGAAARALKPREVLRLAASSRAEMQSWLNSFMEAKVYGQKVAEYQKRKKIETDAASEDSDDSKLILKPSHGHRLAQ